MPKKELPHQLKICLISRKFPIRGRAADHSYLWMIAKRLSNLGHKVTVIAQRSPQSKSEVLEEGVQVYYLDNDSKHSPKNLQSLIRTKFAELHRSEAFDIVHTIDKSGYKVIKNSQKFKVATAADVEATNIAQIFTILGMTQDTVGSALSTSISVLYKFLRTYNGDRRLLKSSNGIFVSSPQQRLFLERYYLYPDRRIFTVAYGIEIPESVNDNSSRNLKEQYSLPERGDIIATVSDMIDVEEVKTILEALQKVVIKKPETRLIIIGNGPKKKEIEFETYKLALGNFVHFTGAINNIELPDYISNCSIFINLSSRSTGFEASVLEAMTQKKLVIASEVSALASLIEDRKDGFLVRPADINGVSRLLLEIINEEIPIKEVGAAAKSKVQNYFDPEKMISNTINAYYDILRNSGYYKKN